MEEKIRALIQGIVEDLGFEIVKIIFANLDRKKKLEILIDRLDHERVSVGDCRKVSKTVSAILDVEDIIADEYFLEVRSAGVERPLVSIENYIRFLGKEVKIVLHNPIEETKKIEGKILNVDGELIIIETQNSKITLDFNNIKKANLVLTDEIFRSILSDKK